LGLIGLRQLLLLAIRSKAGIIQFATSAITHLASIQSICIEEPMLQINSIVFFVARITKREKHIARKAIHTTPQIQSTMLAKESVASAS